jgi:hypothetical protein
LLWVLRPKYSEFLFHNFIDSVLNVTQIFIDMQKIQTSYEFTAENVNKFAININIFWTESIFIYWCWYLHCHYSHRSIMGVCIYQWNLKFLI